MKNIYKRNKNLSNTWFLESKVPYKKKKKKNKDKDKYKDKLLQNPHSK